MEHTQAKQIIEAVLFVFGEPIALKRLTDILSEVEPQAIRSLIQSLNTEYASAGRAFQIQEVAGGYQLGTDQQLAPWIRRALQSPKPDSVSKGALETLAIVAYRQPITKAEVEAIRGVDVTAALDTLMERRFIKAVGRKDSPGRPFLYGTTVEFLRHFGLKSIEALPPLQIPTIQEPEAASSVPVTAKAEPGPSPVEAAPTPAASNGQ